MGFLCVLVGRLLGFFVVSFCSLVGFVGYFGLFWVGWLVGWGWVCLVFFTLWSVDMIYNFCLAGDGRDAPPPLDLSS